MADQQDQQPTIPAQGWDAAATRPMSAPTPGSAPSSDATLPLDLNKRPELASTLPGGGVDPDATRPADSLPTADPDATVRADSTASGSDPGTRPTTPGGGTQGSTAATSGTGSSLAPGGARSSTRLGRTRINRNLPVDAQALDERLQLSRTSVLSDMTVVRGEQGMPSGLLRLLEEQGTAGRYHINRPLAQGGMGAVLHIEDNDFRRGAAMKVIHGQYAHDQSSLERFLAEAQVTAQLEHPNIVPIHDLGVMADGTLYFTMKLIEGRSLGQVVKLRRLAAGLAQPDAKKPAEEQAKDLEAARAEAPRWTVEETLLVFLKILDGVGFAHSRGVVHRDLKPDNVMLGAHGEVLVVDWGIAKVLKGSDPASELVQRVQRQVVSIRDQHASSETMAGSAMGTVFYMPPEQAQGDLEAIDARSDIYALGATLYELLSLKRCLEPSNVPAMILKITSGDFIPLDRAAPGLDPDLVAIVHKAMALDRTDRYADCAAFATDLRRHLAGQAVAARRRNLLERVGRWYGQHRLQVNTAAAVALLVALSAGGTAWWLGRRSERQAADLLQAAQTGFADAGDDVKRLAEAKGLIDRSLDLHGSDPAIRLQATIAAALARAQEKAEAEAARQTRYAEARKAFREAGERRGDDIKEAVRAIELAMRLAPDDPDIKTRYDEILALARSVRQQEQVREARRLREEGDALLAQAAGLDRADPRVAGLLGQAEARYALAEKEVRVEGTQEKIKTAAALRLEAQAAQARQEDARRAAEAAAEAIRLLAQGGDSLKGALSRAEQALAFEPGRKEHLVLRDRAIAALAQAEQARQLAEMRRECRQCLDRSKGALAASRLEDALEHAKRAADLAETDPDPAPRAEAREQVAAVQKALAQREAQRRRDETLAKATALLTEAAAAEGRLAELRAGMLAAQARAEGLSRSLAMRPVEEQKPLFAALADMKTARAALVENWAGAEAAANAAQAAAAEYPDSEAWAKARSQLARLYHVRLKDARATRNLPEIAAFTNLLRRVDDAGAFAATLRNEARLIVQAAGAVTARRLEEAADHRLLPIGEPVALEPGKQTVLQGGAWQITSGTVALALTLDPENPRTLVIPAQLPAVPGLPLRWVPPPPGSEGKGFLLGETEVTRRQYLAFLNHPDLLAANLSAYKAFLAEDDPQKRKALLARLRHLPLAADLDGLIGFGFAGKRDRPEEPVAVALGPNSDGEAPVSRVTRDDAEAFCAWLSAAAGVKARLPLKTERIWAAQGGDDRRFWPWGQVFSGGFAVSALAGHKREARCGSVEADLGPFGHRDLAGNLREWLGDRPRPEDPLAAGANGALIAGGSWSDDDPRVFRSDYAESVVPGARYEMIGFRVLIELP